MNRSLKVVRSTLHPVQVNYDVSRALDPNYKAPLPCEKDNYSPHCYSRLFRAYSAACGELNHGSAPTLIDRTVEIPQDVGWLGGKLLELLNSSLERKSDSVYSFTSRTQSSSTVCQESEDLFVDNLGHTEYEIVKQKKTQTVYVNEENQPILFTKGEGVRSTISFADIAVNGIIHPAGTIFRARQKPKTSFKSIAPGLEMGGLSNISSIQPLRMSLFPIPPDERLEAVLARDVNPYDEDTQIRLARLPTMSRLDFFLRQHVKSYEDSFDRNPNQSLA